MDTFMRLKRNNDALMLDLIGDGINSIEFDVHLRSIKALKKFSKLFVNIANLTIMDNDVLNEFLKMKSVLTDKTVCFINVNPTQNAILNLFGIDKMFQIYMNKRDAVEAKKPIINRKFRIV